MVTRTGMVQRVEEGFQKVSTYRGHPGTRRMDRPGEFAGVELDCTSHVYVWRQTRAEDYLRHVSNRLPAAAANVGTACGLLMANATAVSCRIGNGRRASSPTRQSGLKREQRAAAQWGQVSELGAGLDG